MDFKNWDEAARWMRAAIAENPEASKKRIPIGGAHRKLYLPHFYLGRALFNASRDNCEEALREFETSVRQKVILKAKSEYRDLQEARQICHDLLLEPAIEEAKKQIGLASAAEKRLAEQLRSTPDPALDEDRRAAREKLDQARDKLVPAETEWPLSSLREAESLAVEAERRLNELTQRVARRLAERLDHAASAERQAIIPAEEAEQDVRAPAGPTLDPPSRLAEMRREADEPAASAETVERDRRPQRSERLVDPAVAGEIRRLTEAGERLLFLVGTEETGSRLLETQRSRLTVLVLEARRSAAGEASALERLRDRLAASLTALQLIAGARAYLSGDPRQAIELLSVREVASGRLAAQVHLFLAAALFSLDRLGGGSDEALRRQAAASVRECARLDPQLLPGPRRFPPPFRAFFDRHRGPPSPP